MQNAATALLSGRLCILPGTENGRAQGIFPLIIAWIQVELEFYKPSSPNCLRSCLFKRTHFSLHILVSTATKGATYAGSYST